MLFQSTHPRGVRPKTDLPVKPKAVSIHAPAWGATVLLCRRHFSKLVSIHAPAWGATPFSTSRRSIRGFQSTHPRGVRPRYLITIAMLMMFQSTHPRGVRLNGRIASVSNTCFNPRTRVGCDPPQYVVAGFESVSIHAPAWGATCKL